MPSNSSIAATDEGVLVLGRCLVSELSLERRDRKLDTRDNRRSKFACKEQSHESISGCMERQTVLLKQKSDSFTGRRAGESQRDLPQELLLG
jgi:hypothetical protein